MSEKKLLNTQYHLEVYENSFANDPSYFMDSATPILGISIGDFFNHRSYDGWCDRPKTENEKFIIKEIDHIFWTLEGSHNVHKMMVLIKKVSYQW
ncbi:hypothetical protein RCS94_09510 [Orbaceae bacterium ac157xtp]